MEKREQNLTGSIFQAKHQESLGEGGGVEVATFPKPMKLQGLSVIIQNFNLKINTNLIIIK